MRILELQINTHAHSKHLHIYVDLFSFNLEMYSTKITYAHT